MSRPLKLSRRDVLFGRIGAAVRRAAPQTIGAPFDTVTKSKRAVIQGRHCLAYRELMCSTCYERCPEPGAIVVEQGIPRVVADLCTGCGECHAVCPAPVNAVLVIQSRAVGKRGDA